MAQIFECTECGRQLIDLGEDWIGDPPCPHCLFHIGWSKTRLVRQAKKGDLELVEEHNKKIEQLENEAVRRLKKKLYFFSRHEPNNGQIAVAKELGFDEIERVELVFSTISAAPEEDIEKKGILEKTIAIVAPTFITARLLNKGYTIIEFVNSSIKRERNVFCCKGAYKYSLKHPIQGVDCQTCMAHIQIEYHDCLIPLEEQIESSLQPEKRGA